MFSGRLRLCHGHQGIWRRRQTNIGWEQSIYTPKHIRVRYRCDKLHIGADELFQQGSRHVFHQRVRSSTRYALDVPHLQSCSVNPMYYVGFSTATIVASLILFQGFNTTDGTNTLTLLAGFIVTFLGVHLLNLSRKPDSPKANGHSTLESGLMNPRMSLQGRPSLDGWGGTSELRSDGILHSASHGRQSSLYRAQSNTLFSTFEEGEDGVAGMPLSQLRESEEEGEENVEGAEEDSDADERTRLHSEHRARPSVSRSHSNSPAALRGSAGAPPRVS